MTTATLKTLPLTQPIATTYQKRGFQGIKCLACGEETIRVYVDDVMLFQCSDCEAELNAAEIAERIAGWERLLAWTALAPILEE